MDQCILHAVLSNAQHPEYGEVSMPLPIKATEYGHCMELLSSLGIGDALSKDCQVAELIRAYPTLRCLEGSKVNIDELDYLAKRLDGFDAVEVSQFQAMADKLKLTDMKDLINLTFSCQQATVIADFSDLESVGRAHYMNTHDGCASAEELDNLDGEETAILLIEDNEGTITRYGVVYDNGMQLSQLYDGKNLPCYHHENDCISVGLTSRLEPRDTKNITWVYLPTSNCQIERAMKRAGITDPGDLSLRMGDSLFPVEIDVALDFQREDIYALNELAKAVDKLSNDDRMKLGVVVGMARPENANQICRLAENLDLFEFAPGAHTPAEYGKFMIQQSGHFNYDPTLDEFYDYERYGRQHILPLFSAGRSRRLTLVPIIQSLAQLEKNYGKEGSEIIQDNCQDTIFGGFAPGSQTAEVLSKNLGTRTVQSGSVSQSKNDPSQSLQMVERPLMTPDELRSIPKGHFVVMKTGCHPMQTRLRLFLEWGITFEKEGYTVPARKNAQVYYAGRKELEESILCHSRKNAASEKADTAPPQNGGQEMTEADAHTHPSDDSSLRT